jgi:hypothetical protein
MARLLGKDGVDELLYGALVRELSGVDQEELEFCTAFSNRATPVKLYFPDL